MDTLKWHRVFSALICLALALALALTGVNVKASPTRQGMTDFAAIDAYITEQMNNLELPGLALGIVRDGQIVHLQGFGVADSSGRAVTPQTPFYIGSVTKSFTALAVMQLVEAGHIDLDAPVQTYLPWFELADKEAAARITVRNLLNQTTGISTKDGNSLWSSHKGLEETVRGLDTLQLTKPVGTTYQYSNINYMVAGLIIEKVSGQPYADYVTEHIFEPLGMRHSYASRAPALADGLAKGHIYMFGRVFSDEGPMPPANLPAGTLIATAEDLAHYAMTHLNDGQYGDVSIVSPSGMATLHAPAISTRGEDRHYAMGWEVGPVDGIPSVWHNGDAGRNHSIIILMPNHDSGFVLLANAGGYELQGLVDSIAVGVFSLLNDKPPARASQSIGVRLQYWGLLLAPLLQILGIVLVWRNRQRMKGWLVVLTVILNLAVVWLLFRLALQIITLSSMLVFFPDVGYALVVVAALGIGWSVLYTAVTLRTWRAK